MPKRLKRKFFTRPTLVVAKDLLGKYLVRKIGKEILSGKIVETEAYIGPYDKASHAYGGKITPRNKAEYLIGGHIYIYLVYGMYWQLNIVTEQSGKPECVLVRAIELENGNFHLTNGPGKLCRFLNLDKSFYVEDLTSSFHLWLEEGCQEPIFALKHFPLRFFICRRQYRQEDPQLQAMLWQS